MNDPTCPPARHGAQRIAVELECLCHSCPPHQRDAQADIPLLHYMLPCDPRVNCRQMHDEAIIRRSTATAKAP